MLNRIHKKIMAVCLSLIFIFASVYGYVPSMAEGESCGANDKRACWISFLDMESYLMDLTKEEFRAKVSSMYDLILDNSMNTVIVHVRAMGDAMYPSEYFPFSTYISSDRSISYDPLEIMVELAHEKSLFFEAWINPYRLSKNEATTLSYKTTEFYEKYKEITIEYENETGETSLSLDPSKPETNQLICAQIEEILNCYEVDGIHFDDYFYMPNMVPELEIATKKSYVNEMVKSVYSTVKSLNPNITFGISPAGNTESARSQGADIDTWLSVDGYVDYIMPQIYWSNSYIMDEELTTLYTDRCMEWMSLNTIGVDIYSGLALYRVGEDSQVDLGWAANSDNLKSQYEIAHNLGYDGFALFRYEWLEMEISATELTNLNSYCDSIPDGYVYLGNTEVAGINDDTEADVNNDIGETQATETTEVTMAFSSEIMFENDFMSLYKSEGKSEFWNIMSISSYYIIVACNIMLVP